VLLDQLDQLVGFERLAEVVRGPHLGALLMAARMLARGEDHHRDAGGRGVALQAGQRLPAVDARHHDVEQDQVGALALGLGDAVLAVGRGLDAEARCLEHHLGGDDDQLLVFDDQDGSLHTELTATG
jgi:hypothetical protein